MREVLAVFLVHDSADLCVKVEEFVEDDAVVGFVKDCNVGCFLSLWEPVVSLLLSKLPVLRVAKSDGGCLDLSVVGVFVRQVEVSRPDEGLELIGGAVLVVEQATLLAIGAIRNSASSRRLEEHISVLLRPEFLLLYLQIPPPVSHRPVRIVWRAFRRVRKVALELNHFAWSRCILLRDVMGSSM